MCSNGEDEAGCSSTNRRIKTKYFDDRLCVKCKSNKATVAFRQNDVMCRLCFVSYINHKFRSTLGKSKMVRETDKIMIVYNGDIESALLLHLILKGRESTVKKKIRFLPSLLFIDESEVFPDDVASDVKSQVGEVKRVLGQSQLDAYVTSIGNVWYARRMMHIPYHHIAATTTPNSSPSNDPLPGEPPHGWMRQLLADIKSPTNKMHVLQLLRKELLLNISSQLGFKKVMFADTATTLSKQLFSDFALACAHETGGMMNFAEKTNICGVTVFRPLRELTAKEVGLYSHLEQLTAPVLYGLETKISSGRDSVERLTEHFLAKLQGDFPSTVSTVLRTGEKMINHRRGEESSEPPKVIGEVEGESGTSDKYAAGQTRCKLCYCDLLADDESDPMGGCSSRNAFIHSLTLSSPLTEDPATDSTSISRLSGLCFGCYNVLQNLSHDSLSQLHLVIGER